MLGVAALIGADARVPAMVLQRAPLGQRGSYLATGLNVLQCLGWSVFEITVIAIAAGALSQRLFGVHLIWMWKLVFGALGLVLALLGPIGFVRRFVRKIGIWAVAASIVYLAVWILRNGARRATLWHARRQRRLVLARRRPRDRADRVVGAARRRLHALLARPALGVRRRGPRLPAADALSVRLRRDPRALAPVDRGTRRDVLTTVAAGGVGSVLALLALTVDETDEAFANIYSTAVSLQNYVAARLAARC